MKSASRSEAPLAVTSHLGPSLVLHPRFFLALASERLGLGWGDPTARAMLPDRVTLPMRGRQAVCIR